MFLAPSLPWGWIDAPPSLNRLIGLRWLLQTFYPAEARLDLRADTRAFYDLFYGVSRATPSSTDCSVAPTARDARRSAVGRRAGRHPRRRRAARGDARPLSGDAGRGRLGDPALAANRVGPIDTVLFQIRLPRVLAALAVGAALAAAGASYQTLFRNPLVSPDILGVSAGAGFGAVLGILLSLPVLGIQVLGFATGLATVCSSTASPARCAARTRSSCWCWPASWSARWPAPASRS